MAHAKKNGSKEVLRSDGKNSWGGWFVRCNVPEEHMATIKSIPMDFNRLSEWEEKQAELGRKLSVSYSKEKKTFTASLTDLVQDSPTYKGTLSAFGPSLWAAKITLWWKNEELLQGIWTVEEVIDQRWG